MYNYDQKAVSENIDAYISILSTTMVKNYVLNNEDLMMKIMVSMLTTHHQDILIQELKRIMLPTNRVSLNSGEDTLESFTKLYRETVSNHLDLLALSEEQKILKSMGLPANCDLSKEQSNELLNKLKKHYIGLLELEFKKYDATVLLLVYLSIADRLATLSTLIATNLDGTGLNIKPHKDNDFSIIQTLICQMDTQNLLVASNFIGREKRIIDILFNGVYKFFLTNDKEEQNENYLSEIDFRTLYQIGYMIMSIEIYQRSNEILYKNAECLKIKDYTMVQSGNIQNVMLQTQSDILNFTYDKESVSKVFEQYSKREGFCPQDLFDFVMTTGRNNQTQIHLKTYNTEILKELLTKITHIKDYGINRFMDVLTLKKEIIFKDITDKNNKISIYPFVELEKDIIIYSDSLLLQAYKILEPRMLQQSFTTNKKLQQFISKNYDEKGINYLVKALKSASLPFREHFHLDKINDTKIKKVLGVKGITKEFDLIFVRNKVLYVVEYKTWKMNSHNVLQIFDEQTKILKNVQSHEKTIDIIKRYQNEFSIFMGGNLSEFESIKLIMVFQNPTAFKYLKRSSDFLVFSPKDFIEFI